MNERVVLYLEDDRLCRETLQMYLEDVTGYEVIACASIEEWEEYRADGPVDLGVIVKDHCMPADPQEALARLREMHPGIPVLCHTGSADLKETEHGYDGVFYKPEEMGELCDAVRDAI
ncbi:response regulator [Nanoarchaeota archaeon]